MGTINRVNKLSKKAKLMVMILAGSVVAVFSLLAVLLYINFYARVNVVLTTISRYEDGDIKNVSEYDIVRIKKGRNISYLPSPSVEGYNFEGWYFDESCDSEFDYTLGLEENMQIYGKLSLIEYNIQLVLDDGITVESNVSRSFDYNDKFTIEDIIELPYEYDTILLDDGSETSVSEYKYYHKEGYTFEGWGFSSSNANVVANRYKMTANNLTFYAVWRPITVELQYCTMDLSFAETEVQNNAVNNRLNLATGGISYTGAEEIVYVSETLSYGTKVSEIANPVDVNNNFEFSGWYMDPNFTVAVRFGQLYIRTGYFTLTKESNENILYDPLYFAGMQQMPTPEEVEYISTFSKKDEHDSWIKLYAKWTPKPYTIEYHLNLPDIDSYVKLDNMAGILSPNVVSNIIYEDNGDTIRMKENVYQGCYLKPFDEWISLLYDVRYFEDCVYNIDDVTKLPLYTIKGWNSDVDGLGYDIQNASEVFFDKAKFKINGNVISIYAQWERYNRINYYYTNGSANTKVLLKTENVKTPQVSLYDFYSLVSGVNPLTREITFTDSQIEMNSIAGKKYQVRNNSTFIGWTNSFQYSAGRTELYMTGQDYRVGTEVHTDQGLYVNDYSRDLYTAWLENTNYYTYDLGEPVEDVVFATGSNIKSLLLDARGNYIINKFTGEINHYTLQTVSSSKFMVTVDKGDRTHSLMGWKLKDDTFISGQTAQIIDFGANSKIPFVSNSELYPGQYSKINTNVYYPGKFEIDNANYCTEYVEKEDRSYIYLKAQNVRQLTMTGVWVENSVLSFDAGVEDVVWAPGYDESDLSTRVGGSTDVVLPSVDGMLSRPYYVFAGWSTKNREGTTIVGYNSFVEQNIIFEANTKYNMFDYIEFQRDTTLYAVWRPVIYSLSAYSKEYNSGSNTLSQKIYIAKERLIYDKKSATDNIVFAGDSLSYYDVNDDLHQITLASNPGTGYGLSGWTTETGVELDKREGEVYYEISIIDGINSTLFNANPKATGDYLVNIFPMFGILKFNVNIIRSGEGLAVDDEIEVLDVEHGTKMLDVLLGEGVTVENSNFLDSYEYAGWEIHGDVDNSGKLLSDYIVDLNTSNKIVRSHISLTLKAIKKTYQVNVKFTNPQGNEVETKTWIVDHGVDLGTLNDELYAVLQEDKYNYVGYNFANWDITANGVTTPSVETLDGTIVFSRYDLTTKFKSADIDINITYYSDDSVNTDNIETVSYAKKYGEIYYIDNSTLAVAPIRNKHILKGWSLDLTKEKYFADLEAFALTNEVIDFRTYENVEDNGIKTYTLNFQAKWVESKLLTFNIANATLTTVIPLELEYEVNAVVNFNDLLVSSLNYTQITQNNYLGRYKGIWTDQDGREFAVNVSNTTITMNKDYVLTPKFDAVNYYINFRYRYNGEYTTLSSAAMQVSDDYTTTPVLHSEVAIQTLFNEVAVLRNYQALSYYLTQSAYENKDSSMKFAIGAEFDFVNNLNYLLTRNNDVFTFVIEMEKISTVFYYDDNAATANTIASVRVLTNFDYTIGTSEQGSATINITPEKFGYDFMGWATRVNGPKVYDNGQTVVYNESFETLYPVWSAKDVTIVYHSRTEEGVPEDNSIVVKYDSTITFVDQPRNDYRSLGWAETGAGTPKYSVGQTIAVSELYSNYTNFRIDVYMKYERLYYIYYDNDCGEINSTPLQSLIPGESITLLDFADTGLVIAEGGTFKEWLINGEAITDLQLESGDGNTITYNGGKTISLSDEYSITFTATWEIATYSIRFRTFDADGNLVYKYGAIDAEGNTSIVNTEQVYQHDRTKTYTFTFPSTAGEYVNEEGYKRIFSGWGDYPTHTGDPYINEIQITLTKNYDFVALYYFTSKLVFLDADGNDLITYDQIVNETLSMNVVESAFADYNTTLASINKKVLGFSCDTGAGVKYYGLPGKLSELEKLVNESIIIGFTPSEANTTITFTPIVAEYVDVVIYKDYDYVNSTFTNPTTIPTFLIGDNFDATSYCYVNGDYNTLGFVFSTDANYEYNPNATHLGSSWEILETMDGVDIEAGMTLYFYPIIEAKITLTVNISNVVETSYAIIGTTYTLDYVHTNSSEYLTEWRDSATGAEYNPSNVITGPITFNANTKPYWSVQVNSNVSHIITNYASLQINSKKPEDSVNLPVVADVAIATEYRGDYNLQGWYVSYANNYMMDGTSRKVYALGEAIVIGDVLKELLGEGYENTTLLAGYSLTISPVWDYLVYSLTIDNTESLVTYDYGISDISSSDYDESDFEGTTFYLLNGSEITFRDITLTHTTVKSMTFTAYLYSGGKVLLDSEYNPIIATITIIPDIEEGYESSAWCNTANPTEALANFNISGNVTLKTLTPAITTIEVIAVLKFNDGTNETTLTAANYNQYKKYCYLSSSSGDSYGKTFVGEYNSEITFTVVCGEGCFVDSYTAGEVVDGVYSFTGRLTNDLADSGITIVVSKKSVFNAVVEVVNTSGITDFDEDLINSGSIKLVQTFDGTTSTIAEVGIADALADESIFEDAVNNGATFKVETDFNSMYYYVDTIIITEDEVETPYDTNDMVADNRAHIISGVPHITIVLKPRTYSVLYTKNGETTQRKQVDAAEITDTINITIPSYGTNTGHTLQGVKVLVGATEASATQVDYITEATDFDASTLITTLENVNSSTQDTKIYLIPVYTRKIQSICLISPTSDYFEGYYIIESEDSSEIYDGAGDGPLTLGKGFKVFQSTQVEYIEVKDGDVITQNITRFPVVESVTVSETGEVTEITKNYTIRFIPRLSYELTIIKLYRWWNGLRYIKDMADGILINQEMYFYPFTRAGNSTATISISDGATTDYNNKNLEVAKILETSHTFSYNNEGVLTSTSSEILYGPSETKHVNVNCKEGFYISSYDIIVNVKSYDTTNRQFIVTQYKLSEGVSLTRYGISYTIANQSAAITMKNVKYDIDIILNLERREYDASIQLETPTAGSTLENLIGSQEYAVKLGSQNLTTSAYSLDEHKLRESVEYDVSFNNACFDIESVYYMYDGTKYEIYNIDDSVVLSNVLTDFDLVNGKLTVVFGEHYGYIDIYIKLALKSTYGVQFHRNTTDDTMFHIYGYTDYAYSNTLSLNHSDLYVPNNIEIGASQMAFSKWTYYDGNYDLDKKNNAIDTTKFKDFSSLNWTFDETKGDLHLFANWEKVFNVVFVDEYELQTSYQGTLTNISPTQKILPFVEVYEGYSSFANLDLYGAIYNGKYYCYPGMDDPVKTGLRFYGFTFEFDNNRYDLLYEFLLDDEDSDGIADEGRGFYRLIKNNSQVLWNYASARSDRYRFTLHQLLSSQGLYDEDVQSTIVFKALWKYPLLKIDSGSYGHTILKYNNGMYKQYDNYNYTEFYLTVFDYNAELSADYITYYNEMGQVIDTRYAVISKVNGQIVGGLIANTTTDYSDILYQRYDYGNDILGGDGETPLTSDTSIKLSDYAWGLMIKFDFTNYVYYTLTTDIVHLETYGNNVTFTNLGSRIYYKEIRRQQGDFILGDTNGSWFSLATNQSAEIDLYNWYHGFVIRVVKGNTLKYNLSCNGVLYKILANGNLVTTHTVTQVMNESMNVEYILELNESQITFESYLKSDTNNISTVMGDFSVNYYRASRDSDDNIIFDYSTLYTENSSNGTISINNKHYNKYYIIYDTINYELVETSGGKLVKENGQYFIDFGNVVYSAERTIKLYFEKKKAETNFNINGETYASAYFEGTNELTQDTTLADVTPNAQMVAFAHMITLGYKELYENYETNAQYREWLEALFSSTTGLKGITSSTVVSTVIKDYNSYKYYTEADFVRMFYYPVNQNIATYYYDVNEWQNIWFEGWNFDAYAPLTGVDIDGLFVPLGSTGMNFANLPTSDALILTFDMTSEEYANGGIKITEIAGETYNYYVLGDSQMTAINGVNCYKTLRIKVKAGTTLPKFEFVGDKHTYIDQTTKDTLDALTGKVLTCESGVVNSVEVDVTKEYEFDMQIKVKKVKVNIVCLTDTSQDIMTISTDGTLFNYQNTYNDIIDYHNVSNITSAGVSYTLKEVKTQYVDSSNHYTWYSIETLQEYLEAHPNNAYYDEALTITVKLIYRINS